jgi:transcriptional regulator with XRE-family HTH domain
MFLIYTYVYTLKGVKLMLYNDNEQLVIELKKLLIDNKCSQRDIAKKMGISPQALQNLLNKKQLSFSDMKKVLDCINYDLLVEFSSRNKS